MPSHLPSCSPTLHPELFLLNYPLVTHLSPPFSPPPMLQTIKPWETQKVKM